MERGVGESNLAVCFEDITNTSDLNLNLNMSDMQSLVLKKLVPSK